jgi:hypothetical protein
MDSIKRAPTILLSLALALSLGAWAGIVLAIVKFLA